MQALRNVGRLVQGSTSIPVLTLPLLISQRYSSKTAGTAEEKPRESLQERKEEVQRPKRTQAEADAALMAAYREKFGGETTATFEDGKPSEMGRAVRNNMFRYI